MPLPAPVPSPETATATAVPSRWPASDLVERALGPPEEGSPASESLSAPSPGIAGGLESDPGHAVTSAGTASPGPIPGTASGVALILVAIGLVAWLRGGRFLRAFLTITTAGIAAIAIWRLVAPPGDVTALGVFAAAAAALVAGGFAFAARRVVVALLLAASFAAAVPAAVVAGPAILSLVPGSSEPAPTDPSVEPRAAGWPVDAGIAPVTGVLATGERRDPAGAAAPWTAEESIGTLFERLWESGSDRAVASMAERVDAPAGVIHDAFGRGLDPSTVERMAGDARAGVSRGMTEARGWTAMRVVDVAWTRSADPDARRSLAVATAIAALLGGLWGLLRPDSGGTVATAAGGAALLLAGAASMPALGTLAPTLLIDPDQVAVMWLLLVPLGALLQWRYRPQIADDR